MNNSLSIQILLKIIKKKVNKYWKTENNKYEDRNQLNIQKWSQNNPQAQSNILRNKSLISQSVTDLNKKNREERKK